MFWIYRHSDIAQFINNYRGKSFHELFQIYWYSDVTQFIRNYWRTSFQHLYWT